MGVVMTDLEPILQLLIERMKAKGWSYIQLAKRAQVSEYAAWNAVTDYPNTADMRLSTLTRLCKALGLKVVVA